MFIRHEFSAKSQDGIDKRKNLFFAHAKHNYNGSI